jgi:acyl carrier protein
MLNREQAQALVLRRLAALGRELGKPALEKADGQARLFGEAAALDSIGLVTLIADLEETSASPPARPSPSRTKKP